MPLLAEEDGSTASTSSAPGMKLISVHIKTEMPNLQQRLAQVSPGIAEFIGSLLQALAWNCTELGKESSKAGEWKPLVLGLMLMVNTYSFASISGAHLNPAISLSVGLSDKGQWYKLARFVIAQTLGSAAGVALSCATYQKTAASAIGPRHGFTRRSCFFVEFIFTAMICLVYLNVTLSRRCNPIKGGNQFYGVAIGFALSAGVWAAEEVSGAIFNPALALSVDFQNAKNGYGNGFFYCTAQVLGVIFASLLYRVIRPSEEEDDHESWQRQQVSKHAGVTMPKLTVEFVGTWYLVFTFGMATLSTKYHDDRPLAAAAALTSLHYALADVTGGHFNPAVTFSMLLSGRQQCSNAQGVAFMVVQVVAAAIGAFAFTGVNHKSFPALNPGSQEKYGWFSLSAVDAIYAFCVCYTALATITVVGVRAVPPAKRNYYDGLAYGLSSAAGGFAMLNILNSLANPALTLGEALVHAVTGTGTFYMGIVISWSQFMGAVIASCLFRCTHSAYYREGRLTGENAPLLDNMMSKGLEKASEAGAATYEEVRKDTRLPIPE